MRKTIAAVMMVAFAMVASGCSDDDGKDVCQQYADAFKACVNALDCSTFTDATKKAICDGMKAAGTGTGTGTGTPVACTGTVKDTAEKALAAGFDELCLPKTTTPGPEASPGLEPGPSPEAGTPDMAMMTE